MTFGEVVKDLAQRNTAKRKAVIKDLVGDDQTLLEPLRALVELLAFLEAEPLVASANARLSSVF